MTRKSSQDQESELARENGLEFEIVNMVSSGNNNNGSSNLRSGNDAYSSIVIEETSKDILK